MNKKRKLEVKSLIDSFIKWFCCYSLKPSYASKRAFFALYYQEEEDSCFDLPFPELKSSERGVEMPENILKIYRLLFRLQNAINDAIDLRDSLLKRVSRRIPNYVSEAFKVNENYRRAIQRIEELYAIKEIAEAYLRKQVKKLNPSIKTIEPRKKAGKYFLRVRWRDFP